MIVEYEQFKQELAGYEEPIKELGSALDIEGAKEEAAKLEKRPLTPTFTPTRTKAKRCCKK